VLIAGNHDSPIRLAFGARLLEQSRLAVAGEARPRVVFTLDDEHGRWRSAPCPTPSRRPCAWRWAARPRTTRARSRRRSRRWASGRRRARCWWLTSSSPAAGSASPSGRSAWAGPAACRSRRSTATSTWRSATSTGSSPSPAGGCATRVPPSPTASGRPSTGLSR
jgi:hypothetical protein